MSLIQQLIDNNEISKDDFSIPIKYFEQYGILVLNFPDNEKTEEEPEKIFKIDFKFMIIDGIKIDITETVDLKNIKACIQDNKLYLTSIINNKTEYFFNKEEIQHDFPLGFCND